MISKTRMLALVQGAKWQDVRRAVNEHRALLDVRDKKGRNWLHLACARNAKQHHVKPADCVRTAEVLLDAGLDINDAAFTQKDWKATPLWYAVAFGKNIPLARFLLERGSSPDYCLYAAAWNDDAPMIRLLFRHGAPSPPAKDATPFLAAIAWRRFAAAEAFLDHGADIDFQDPKGRTALHVLVQKGVDVKAIRMLLRRGARTDIPDAKGATALQMIRRKRDLEIRRLAT